jgi:6-phosphogluconolactonase (cycloisomerase 2 family)
LWSKGPLSYDPTRGNELLNAYDIFRKKQAESWGKSMMKVNIGRAIRNSLFLVAVLSQAGCGGDDNDNDQGGSSGQTHSVGGTVASLSGSNLKLRNNGGDELTVAQSGTFTFGTRIQSGQQYAVTVNTQPTNPTQTCNVAHGSGTMAGSDITNVEVTCTTNSYQIGGTLSGLTGSELTLQNNGGDGRSVTANGSFSFATSVDSGNPYAVTVATQPTNPRQTCVVTNGSGTVGGSNVTNVQVSCTNDTYSVGGGVAGLSGTGLALSFNGGAAVPVGAGAFTLATGVANATNYNVTIASQPSGQTCVVDAGSGTIAEADVSSVEVFCPNAEGRFLLVTRQGGLDTNNGKVSVFAIDGTTGELTEVGGSPFAAGWGAERVATVSDGRFVYIGNYGDGSNSGDGTISAYTTDQSTGALTEIAGSPFGTDGHPTSMAVHPDASRLYVASSGGITTYNIDSTSGALTEVTGSQTGGQVNSVALEPGGKFAFAGIQGAPTFSALTLAVNATTGVLTPASSATYPGSAGPTSIGVDPFGKFAFMVDDPGVAIGVGGKLYAYSIDAATGALQLVPNSPFVTPNVTRSREVAVAPRGKFAYVANNGTPLTTSSLSIYSIDRLTGAATNVPNGPVGSSAGAAGIIVDPSGRFLYVTFSGGLHGYAIDANDGTLAELPGSPYPGGLGGELAIIK